MCTGLKKFNKGGGRANPKYPFLLTKKLVPYVSFLLRSKLSVLCCETILFNHIVAARRWLWGGFRLWQAKTILPDVTNPEKLRSFNLDSCEVIENEIEEALEIQESRNEAPCVSWNDFEAKLLVMHSPLYLWRWQQLPLEVLTRVCLCDHST